MNKLKNKKQIIVSLLAIIAFSIFNFQLSIAQNVNYALNFDGINYVNISNNGMGITNKVTVQAWIKLDKNMPNGNCVFLDKYLSTVDKGFRLSATNNGILNLDGRDGSGTYRSVSVNASLNDFKWHFITCTIDVDQWSVYVDGILKKTKSFNYSTANYNTNTDLRFGSHIMPPVSGWQNFTGSIDEVRIWNRVLSQTEIRKNMSKKISDNGTGLVGYYSMNEGADNTCVGGEDVCDKSGNGNNGIKK